MTKENQMQQVSDNQTEAGSIQGKAARLLNRRRRFRPVKITLPSPSSHDLAEAIGAVEDERTIEERVLDCVVDRMLKVLDIPS